MIEARSKNCVLDEKIENIITELVVGLLLLLIL